jgi:hypothetical protein
LKTKVKVVALLCGGLGRVSEAVFTRCWLYAESVLCVFVAVYTMYTLHNKQTSTINERVLSM